MAGFTPAAWPTESRVTLCRVAWDSSYRDVVRFDSVAERDAYFASIAADSITLEKMTYLKPNEPIFIDVPFSRAYTYNYVVVENPALPVPGEVTPPNLYYFVTSVAFSAPNTTALTLQLDCFQTYAFDLEFGSCFVERGHVAIQAERNTTGDALSDLLPIVCQKYLTAAEGLDVGNEYLVANHEQFNIASPHEGWRVVIMSTTDLAASWGTKDNPSLTTADGQKVDGLIGGCNVYSLTADNFKAFMQNVRNAPWVAKGIISVTAFPSAVLTAGPDVSLNGTPANFLGETPDLGTYYVSGNVFEALGNGIPERYRALRKFFTWPYSVIELNTFNGAGVMLKPELLWYKQLELGVISCAAPAHMKIGFVPYRYGVSQAASGIPGITYEYATMDKQGERTLEPGYFTDVAVWFQNMPQFSLVNDGYLTYLASSAHTRQYNYQSAGWGLAKSNAGTELTFDQAQAALATNQANQDIKNVASIAHMGINGVSSLASGNVGGAIQGTLGGAVDLVSGNMQFQNNQSLQGQFASQNADLAKWAAKGDYQTQIAAIDAAVQDAALTQPSTSGQMGGEGFNLSNGLYGVEIRYRTLDPNHAAIIGEFWYRYGYAVRQFLTPPENLKCCEKFTYWKMSETYLTCARADEGAKDVIRGIFEKGVTVWSNPAEIGKTDIADNPPIAGVIPY